MECLAIDISPSKLARAIIQVLTLKKLACKSKLSKDILDAAIRILLSEDDRTIFPLYFDFETAARISKAISKNKHSLNHESQVKRSNDITADRKKANLIKRPVSNINPKDGVCVKRLNLELHACKANVKEFSEIEQKQHRDEIKKPVVLSHGIVTPREFASSKKKSPFPTNKKLPAHKTIFHNEQPQNHIASVKKSNSITADGQNTDLPKTTEKKHIPNAPVNNSNVDDDRVSVKKPNSKLPLCSGITNGEFPNTSILQMVNSLTEHEHFKSGSKKNHEATFHNEQPQNHFASVKKSNSITADGQKTGLPKTAEKHNPNAPVNSSNVDDDDRVSVKKPNPKLLLCSGITNGELPKTEHRHFKSGSKKNPEATFHNEQLQNHVASVKKSNSITADGQNTDLPKTTEKKHNSNEPVDDDNDRVSIKKPNSKLLLCSGITNGELPNTEHEHFKSGSKKNHEATFHNEQPQNHVATVKKSNSITADGQNTGLPNTAEKKHNSNEPVDDDNDRVSVEKPYSKLLLCCGITNGELPKTEHKHFKSGSKKNPDAVSSPKLTLPHESPPKKRALLPLPTKANHLFHKTIYNEEHSHNHVAAVKESNIVRTDRQSADFPKSCEKDPHVWNIQRIDGISVKGPNLKSLACSVDTNRGISAKSHSPKPYVCRENKNDVLPNTNCKQLRSTIEEKPIAEFLLSRTLHSHESAHKRRALLPHPVNSKPVAYQNNNLPLPTHRKVLLPLPADVFKPTETNDIISTKKKKYETYYYYYSIGTQQ